MLQMFCYFVTDATLTVQSGKGYKFPVKDINIIPHKVSPDYPSNWGFLTIEVNGEKYNLIFRTYKEVIKFVSLVIRRTPPSQIIIEPLKVKNPVCKLYISRENKNKKLKCQLYVVCCMLILVIIFNYLF
jgi:hypothetical protein